LESAYFAEVINPETGQPSVSDQVGELVLTTLGRTGSPLLRYRTGDLVKPVPQPSTSGQPGSPILNHEPCVCGRYELALEGGILGRTDDMVIVRGVNIYPTAVEDIIRSCGEVAEYRVTVNRAHSLTELSVQIEPTRGCVDPSGVAWRLEKAFHDAFALRVPVQAVAPGTLPRFEMKASRWLRL
jgi:phenylacetate-CoA ligase